MVTHNQEPVANGLILSVRRSEKLGDISATVLVRGMGTVALNGRDLLESGIPVITDKPLSVEYEGNPDNFLVTGYKAI